MRGSPTFVIAALSMTSIPSQAADPAWLVEARAKEGKPMKDTSIRSTDGWLEARVPAKLLGKVKLDEGAYQIALDIDSPTPVNCEVIRDGFDSAALLRATLDLTLKEVEPIQGKITRRSIETIDSGVLGSSPFLAANWIYLTDDGKGPKLGALKHIVAHKFGHGIYCSHLEVGYTKTFREVVTRLVDSLTMPWAEGMAEPYFVDISTFAIRDARVGYVAVSLTKDADGDTKVISQSAILAPAAGGDVSANDSFEVQWARPDGSLINSSSLDAQNGETESDLSLKQAEDGTWRVEGTFQGKQLNEPVAGQGPPGSALSQMLARRKLLAAPNPVGTEFTAPYWISDNPTSFNDWTVKVTSALDSDRFSAQESIAGIRFDAIIERSTGTGVSATLELGPVSMRVERVFLRGAL